jgi:hypothetical protein
MLRHGPNKTIVPTLTELRSIKSTISSPGQKLVARITRTNSSGEEASTAFPSLNLYFVIFCLQIFHYSTTDWNKLKWKKVAQFVPPFSISDC